MPHAPSRDGIATRRGGGGIELSVTDTGPGIPPEVRDKIFNLYFSTKEHGSGIGLAMAFALSHAVASLLRGVSPNDPVVFTVITSAVVGTAFLASWIPARRAAGVDPMVALRDE